MSRYLVALVAVAVLPLLIVASVLIWREGVDQRRATEEALQSTAQALSVAVDRQLTSYRRVLEALAASDMIDRRDFATMHGYAKRVAEVKGAIFISLFEPSGRQIFNTARVFGEALPDPFREAQPTTGEVPPRGDASSLRRVFATGRASNSDLFYGLSTGQLMFTIDVPVVRDGKVLYVMNAAFPPKLVTELLTTDEDLRDVHSLVVDGRGFVVGRSRDGEKYTGVRVQADTLALIAHGDQGSTFTRTLDGEYMFRSFARSPQNGWSTLVSIDAAYLHRQEARTWAIWGSVAVAALLLSLGMAAWLARRLDGAIGSLAQAAGKDDAPVDYGLRSREFDRLRDALVAARQSRDAAMRSRESALREEARRIEAEAANRDKDRFMAAVVHELRTPLAALTNVASLMKSGATDGQVTGVLQRQVGQLARLTDDLFEASRVNVGKFNLQFAPLDLRDVVKHAVEATSMRHQHRRQVVDTRLPDAPVMVEGDRTRLAQVVANLVDNAMKFTPSGGTISVELAMHEGHAVLAVVDSGCGIDPQFLPRIFERFAQGPGRVGAGEGLGLGLSVARELVLAHGGRIEAASEGAGARFTVTLPLAAPAA